MALHLVSGFSYEDACRKLKAERLAFHLAKLGVSHSQVPLVSAEQWKLLAQLAGVNLPSEKTIAMVQQVMREQTFDSADRLDAFKPQELMVLTEALSLLSKRRALESSVIDVIHSLSSEILAHCARLGTEKESHVVPIR